MNKVIKYKWVRLVFLSLLSISLASCAIGLPRHWPEKTSRVLDVHTKKPIKDVYLIVKWKGYGGWVGVRTICYHVESAKTNKKGEFIIPEFSESFTNGSLTSRHVSIYLYAPNYIESEYKKKSYYKHNDYLVEKFIGNRKERFSYIGNMARRLSCNDSSKSSRNAYVIYKAIYEEAKLLAITKEEKKKVKWLKFIAAASFDENIYKLTGEALDKKVNDILMGQ